MVIAVPRSGDRSLVEVAQVAQTGFVTLPEGGEQRGEPSLGIGSVAMLGQLVQCQRRQRRYLRIGPFLRDQCPTDLCTQRRIEGVSVQGCEQVDDQTMQHLLCLGG